MFPYFLLILIPGLLCFVGVDKDRRGRRKLYIGTTDHVAANNLALPVFFSMLFFMLACRDITIGNDTGNYSHFFAGYRQISFHNIFAQKTDVLFVLYSWLIGRITDNFQIYLAITAAVTLYPIAKLYLENRRHSFLMIILFVNMSVFCMLFSGIRQCLAIAIGIYAYRFTREKKIIKYLLAVYLALLMHHSAFILILLYPLYHATWQKKHLFIIIPFALAIFAMNERIFAVLSFFLSDYSEVYRSETSETGAYSMLILFILFAVVSYILPEQSKLDSEATGLRNCLVMAVMLQCFAPVHVLSMRLNYYYIILIPMMMPKFIDATSLKYRQLAKLVLWVLCGFFTVYYCRDIYYSGITGTSVLNTVPYVPFWGT